MDAFNRERAGCAYFFAVPGLVYGIFTSRLPAIKSLVGADDSMIGFLLLAFGAASFAGLVGSRPVLARFSAKAVIGVAGLIMPAALTVGALGLNYAFLVGFCLLGGFAGGLCEVAMNAQGMLIEREYRRLCMSSLHACFSLGGMAGSVSGAIFAFFGLSAALNFFVACFCYLLLLPLAYGRIRARRPEPERIEKRGAKAGRLPPFIYFCGLLSMCCYVSEGSVGEWGSILLHSVKGAPQDQAALVFACFCASMVIFRFLGDRLRQRIGDRLLASLGALLGALCMAVVLISPSAPVCLCAYTLMGVGFAPIVPILFSRAGDCGGEQAARVSSAMSILSYTGLLVFPPVLGVLGDHIGLDNALWIIAACCLCVCLGCWRLLGRNCAQPAA